MSSNISFDSIQSSLGYDTSKLNAEGLEVDKFIREMNEVAEKKISLACRNVVADCEIQTMNSIKKLSDKV